MTISIGSAIRMVRQAKGMKVGDVAVAAEISPSFLSLVENGEREPSLAVVRRIADALGVPADALMVVEQPTGGRLGTSNVKAKQLVQSIQRLADAEERLRQWFNQHGGKNEAKRSSA